MGDPTAAARAVRAERRRIARGLLDPNPGAARLTPIPPVMASPPTVGDPVSSSNPIATSAATAGSAIAGSVIVKWTDPRFRFLGAHFAVAGGSYPDTTMARPNSVTHPQPVFYGKVAFVHDGAAFEIVSKCLATNISNQYKLWVNGQPATALAQDFVGTSGGQYLTKVDFGSRAVRRIEIEARHFEFGGVRIGPTDGLMPPVEPDGPRVVMIGDSYTEGSNAGAIDGFAPMLGRLLGWRNLWPSGVGGTGYLNASTGGKTTFRGRIGDVTSWNPDVVIVAGGVNDYANYSAAAIQTEAALYYDAILAGVPGVKLIVVGNFFPNGRPTAQAMQCRDALQSAASGRAHLFIDPIGGTVPYDGTASHYWDLGWLTGSGSVASPAGNGNSDAYTTSGADIHPTTAGHAYLGHRLAAAIAAGLPL